MASSNMAQEGSATLDTGGEVDVIDLPPELSPWRRAMRRFLSHRLAVIGVTVLVILALLAIFADFVSPYSPTKAYTVKTLEPPDSANWLGTDQVGRDTFSRIVHGARISLSVGLVAVSVNLLIAILIGATAGLTGGRADDVLMRFTDFVMTFPSFIMIIIIAGILGPNIFNVMIIIGVLGWPGLARLIRGQILVLRELDYVLASQVLGAPRRYVIRRHLLPNIIGPITVAVTLGVAGAILTEAGLSFLGLGVTEPAPSWGSMISASRGIAYLADRPWLWAAPGIAICLAVLSINFIGDGLRDAFDVRGRETGN